MDLSNSVILPRDDFNELQTTAWDQNQTASERLASIAQTTAVFAVLTGCVVGGSWGWAKAMDWREERRFQREMQLRQNQTHPFTKS